MIALIGDIHGDFRALHRVVQGVPLNATIVQVGDFGFWPERRAAFVHEGLPPMMFIEGNHDHVPYVHANTGVASPEAWPGLEYVPRGTLKVLDGKRVLFVGGATSIDRHWRPRRVGVHPWFEEEDVTEEDVEKALAAGEGGVDLLVTHAASSSVVQAHFPWAQAQAFFNPPPHWRDVSAARIEALWRQLGEPPLVCGHMHRSVVDGPVRILDINEVFLFE